MGIEPDVLYDLEINPNRPDAMSVAGRGTRPGGAASAAVRPARPAAGDGPGRSRRMACRSRSSTPIAAVASRRGCCATCAVGPGDPKLASRLALLGMRSINNVVDVSNYVMLELGQPSHPYDLAKVPGPGFRVRLAREGETLVTLDDVERQLTTDDLLICDADDTPIGIGGIMGGATSEIDDATTDVLLEMAWFHPIGIVKSSRRHKLRSEASARFEKGCRPRGGRPRHAPLRRSARCAAGGRRRRRRPARCPSVPRVRVRTARVARLLGTELPTERIAEVLDPIGFTTAPAGDDLDVDIPSWRYDSETEIDVIEEIARHHGYTALGRTIPTAAPRRVAVTPPGGAPPAPIPPRRSGAHRGHADAVPRAR